MLQLLKQLKISVWGLIFILTVGWCLGASICFADDVDKSVMKIKEIKEPPALAPIVQREMPSKPHYFAKGTIDAVGEGWITINDHQFFIAPGASLGCGVGDFVGIQVNDERKVLSCERVRK